MARAALWLGGSNLASQLLRLVSNLVLTRLLVPEAFGLMALANTLYLALVMCSDLGVWQCVVRSARCGDERFLGTAWMVQWSRAALLASVVVLLALVLRTHAIQSLFPADTVYRDPRAAPMVAAFALAALLQAAESMKLALAMRELRGSELARLEFSSLVASVVTTLLLAALTHSVWAPVIGSLVGTCTRTAMSHWALPGPTSRPCWDRSCARELLLSLIHI